jgi:hypothetical protein
MRRMALMTAGVLMALGMGLSGTASAAPQPAVGHAKIAGQWTLDLQNSFCETLNMGHGSHWSGSVGGDVGLAHVRVTKVGTSKTATLTVTWTGGLDAGAVFVGSYPFVGRYSPLGSPFNGALSLGTSSLGGEVFLGSIGC